MLRMKNILEKNNQSRQKIIGISLTFLHSQPVSFQVASVKSYVLQSFLIEGLFFYLKINLKEVSRMTIGELENFNS